MLFFKFKHKEKKISNKSEKLCIDTIYNLKSYNFWLNTKLPLKLMVCLKKNTLNY